MNGQQGSLFEVGGAEAAHAARMLAGPLAVAAFAATWNAVALSSGRPTVSAGVRWACTGRLGTIVTGAAVGALLAHWFLEPDPDDGT